MFLPNIGGSTSDDLSQATAHARNDYDLAEEARQRNEPPFELTSEMRATAALADPAVQGQWGPVVTWPFVFAAAASLPDGRILAWGGNNPTSFNGGTNTYATVWNPITSQFLSVNHTSHSAFCAIPTMLEDGRVFLNGGDGTRERTSTFDYRTNTWTRIQNMSVGRWYNGAVALPDGRVLTAGGDPGNNFPEIWSPGNGWSLLTSANLQGRLLGFSEYQSAWLPYFHLAPNGQVFHSGPTRLMNYINPAGSGTVTAVGNGAPWYPKYSAGIMYDQGKILVAGGAGVRNNTQGASTNQAMTIDINGGTPVTTVIAPMAFARKFNASVMLPTGEVMVIGGNSSGIEFSDTGSQLSSEIWNPSTQAWRTMSDMSVPRNYHSVALLMTDGRVWSGGGGLCACSADHPNAQIFSPPYLFNVDGTLATRPTISSAPDGVGVGQSLSVQATAGIARFTMIKMSGTTHNLNSDMRFLNVPFTTSGNDTYQLTLNSNVNVLTPGYWMLFALDAQGVPSVAKVIRIASSGAPNITNPGAQNGGLADSVSLTIQANDINGDTLTYSASGLPPGLSINTSTGLISGALTALGNYNVTVSVSDGTSTPSVAFAWNVAPLSGNMAQGKPTASSSDESATFASANAVDGNIATRWSSQSSDPQWIQIDLGETRSITRVVLNWEAAYGRAYAIQVSNDASNWTTIYGTANGDGGIDDLAGLSGSGRYVRMSGTQRGTQFGYSLWEFEVFGGPASLTLQPLSSSPRPVNTSINYSASASNGVNVRYKWLFGDGTPETAYSASPTASHAFAQPGLYLVKVTVTDDSAIEQSTSIMQAVHLPQTANRPSGASNIVFETRAGSNNRVWVVNQDNDTVSVFDAVTNAKVGEVTVGSMPRGVAVAPNGNIWVTNKGPATISVINPNTLAVAQTIALPFASQPYGISFAPVGNSAFVALEASGRLLKLDAGSGAITGNLDVGQHVRGVAVAADGATVLVSRFVTPRLPGEDTATVNTGAGGGEVLAVNAAAMTVNKTITLRHSDKPDGEAQGRGIPNYVGAAAISPDGQSAWVPSKQDNIGRGVLRDGNALNFQSSVRAVSSRIDLLNAGGTEDYGARVDHDNSSLGSAIAFDPSGSYLFVALETSREVAVVDAYARQEIWRFAVGRAPEGLAVSADGLRLYVNNFMDRTVGVYDLSALINRGTRDFPLLTTLNAVGSERLSAQVLNGKQLFYDARDPRLAREGYLSCAACHNDGGQDGRVWDFTGFGEGLRNTVELRGRTGAHGFLHWSGNFNEAQDFEGQIRNFAGGLGLMTDAQFNTGTRNQPQGDPKAGVSVDLDALVAYLASLNSFASSPYRNTDGTLTTDAQAGRTVFQNANCAQCHGGTAFSSSGAATLFNVGTLKPSSGQRLGAPLTGIDPPTLRDVWASGPYLHDGSAATLSDAVSAHNNVSLNATQIQQLVAYLQQVGGQEATAPAPVANQPPSVILTAPANNATFTAPATVNIAANASDADGTIAIVEFFNGATKLGEDTTAPYAFNWTNVPSGTYALTARATDNAGASTTSAVVNITVNVAAPPSTNIAPQGTAYRWWGMTASANDASKATTPVLNDNNANTQADLSNRVSGHSEPVNAWEGAGVTWSTARTVNTFAFTNGTWDPTGDGTFCQNVSAQYTTNGTSWLESGWAIAPAYVFNAAGQNRTYTFTGSSLANVVGLRVVGQVHPPSGTCLSWYANVREVYAYASAGGANQPPSVSITAPAIGATFTAPATVNIAANASDADGTITVVEFFNGATKLGEDTTSPYAFSWTNVAAGTYAITARVTDNGGASTTSTAVNITVNAPSNQPPSVSITAPANGATFTAPATINITANATDVGGTITVVEFFNGATKLGEDTTAPYAFGWANVAAGSYVVTARATDNGGASTTSAVVNITINAPGNQPPSVSITAPANNASYVSPATINITANATDTDGTITLVEFFNGATKLGEDATAPYAFSWANVVAGSYAITARATDNGGASTTGGAVNITVLPSANQPPATAITAPANNATFTAPATVNITANATDADGTVTLVEFFNGATKLGEDATAPYAFSWANVAAGTYAITVRATDNGGASTTSAVVNITVNAPTGCTLPTGFTSLDIGSPGQAGSACESGGVWTVRGSGADIYDVSDQFRYGYQDAPGNVTIVARATSVQNTNFWAKAGVMIRDGTGADAKFAMVVQMPNNEVSFQWRTSTGGYASWNGSRVGGTGSVKWLRLVKSNTSFTAYYATTTAAPTSAQWVRIGSSRTISMATPKVGLAVTSHDNSTLCTATFTNVSVTSP